MQTIFIASDHAGASLAHHLCDFLKPLGYDLKCFIPEQKVDYPDYAALLCKNMKEEDRGILICGSGIGISIAANRFSHIRAALCSEPLSAKLSREHNDANVLCLGARLIGQDMAESILQTFLNTEFEGGRHIVRIEKLKTCQKV